MNKCRVMAACLLIGALIGIAVTFSVCYKSRQLEEERRETYYKATQELSDSINLLKSTIDGYKAEIDNIEVERELIKKEIKIILKDNEETDKHIISGDLDYNVRFLSEYLSKEDSISE